MPNFLYVSETVASVRAKIVGYAQSAGLLISNWIVEGVGMQLIETIAPTVQSFTTIAAKFARGFGSLETSTDPGDDDPYDPLNVTYPAAAGLLSDQGANVYGTDRIGNVFATGQLTFANTGTGAVNQNLTAFSVTFQRSTPSSDGSYATYRNADPIVAAVGITVTIGIEAENPGTLSNASAGQVTVLVSTLPGVTVTNAAAVLASDREAAGPYRDRCRIAPASVSPNGPADAYRYIALGARKNADTGDVFYFPVGSGTTGLGADSSGNLMAIPNATGTSLGVTRVYASKDSATGNVAVYFANATGPISTQDLTDLTALFNAAYWPDTTSRTLFKAIPHAVTVDGAVKAKAGAGVSAAGVATEIGDALSVYFAAIDIGGYDQTAGAGTLYLDEIRAKVSTADGSIYHVTLSSPGGDVALAVGEVAVLTNGITAGDVTVV